MVAKLLILSIFLATAVLANNELESGSEALNNTLSSESDEIKPSVSTLQENKNLLFIIRLFLEKRESDNSREHQLYIQIALGESIL